MTISTELDALDQLVFEDPQAVLPRVQALADREPQSIRVLATLGTCYRRVGWIQDSEEIFKVGLRLPATPFDRADFLRRFSLLCHDRQEWLEALAKLDEASTLHGTAPGLPGPADRGLPALLTCRGMVLRAAAEAGHPAGCMMESGLAYRAALELLDDPRDAPRTYLAAVQGTAYVSYAAGLLTPAQDALWRACGLLRKLGILRTTATGVKVEWLTAAIDGDLFGYCPQQERALLRVERVLHQKGAVLDAVRAGMERALFELEGDPVPWDDLQNQVKGYLKLLDWDQTPSEVLAALGWFYQLARRKKTPLKDLDYVFRSLGNIVRKPDERHVHGGLWADEDVVVKA
jgi:hypothetical protein